MAYRDIQMWRRIMESQDAEQRAYDEACEKNAKLNDELEEKEFWECDQAMVDPNTMGLQDSQFEDLDELEDVEDVDEEIDFSQYQLDEADMREPLQRVSAALGRPASTASLTGQDSVELAEAIKQLTDYLKTSNKAKNRLNEEEEIEDFDDEEEQEPQGDPSVPTDAGWLAWIGGEDVAKGWDDDAHTRSMRKTKLNPNPIPVDVDELTRKTSRALFDRLVKQGKVNGATGKIMPGVSKSVIDGIAKQYRQATDDELDRDPEQSAQALKDAKKFFEKWLADPDWRRMNALKGPQGGTAKVAASGWKKKDDSGKNWIRAQQGEEGAVPNGEVIAGTDPNSLAAKQFKAFFDKMTPEDQMEFRDWATQEKKRFTAKSIGPIHNVQNNKKSDLHGTDGEEDDENPLAQQGFDTTFSSDTIDNDLNDDPDAGEEFYNDVNPDYTTLSHEGVAKRITDEVDDYAQKNGMTRQEVYDMYKRIFKAAQSRNTILRKGRYDGEDNSCPTDWEMEYLFSALDKDELAKFKQELEAEITDKKQLTVIDHLFKFGKDRKITMQMMMQRLGMGGDQKGRSGAPTELLDRHLGMLVAALTQYTFGEDNEEARELLRTAHSQNRTKKDKELGIEPRRYSRHLICKLLQDLYDDMYEPGMKKVVIPQSPAIGPDDDRKITGKDWEEVKKKAADLLLLMRLKMKKSDLYDLIAQVDSVFHDKYGDVDKDGNPIAGSGGTAKTRKFVHYLSPEQQDEFLKLVDDVRTDFGSMSEDAKMRMLTLYFMRFGSTEPTAEAKAKQVKAKGDKKGPNGFDAEVQRYAKAFLSGGSGNMNKDKITVGSTGGAE